MKTTTVNSLIAIEKVESEAWLDMYAAAPDSYVTSSKTSYARLGTSVGLADQGVPIAEFNRVLGLGIAEPLSEEGLDQAIAWMNEHASELYSLQIPPTALPDMIHEWIQAKGFKRTGRGWAKYYRDSMPVESHPMPTTLEVRLVEPHHATDFGYAAQVGFGFPESLISWFSALAGRPKWRVYVAYEANHPVACGAMFIDKNWAWLGIDATLPDYRGRGAQNALIKQRLTDGIALGVTGFTAETGQPPEGQEDTNKSYCNYHRAGFNRVYVRPNYMKVD
ncbi:hypothetical protein HZF08_14510 [Paenibacillus sp. CGMCC 1.16610]|uniref:N-acetyltransferase domain-containing protein n=1 Tax=Paenibacillus anseongense TaxID=2682845 RepID=A0ABW9UIT5_9BACL|nr:MULTISPECIES: GNAT family N-acetyltransferase [Paenibacillus]MBA2939524.1 hypothetical protein [Paenibacillus sp. CGMCC 1.16610]MVQ39187.1 hypothetical protein [Paenibacillus anseongense]